MMRSVQVVAMIVALCGVSQAQVVPELSAYGTVGQRWRDGGRTFLGGTIAIGLSSPATDSGAGLGLRLSFTGFPTRDQNPNIVCIDFCEIPEVAYLLSIMQGAVVLIPYRTSDVEFEFGAGASRTETLARKQIGGLVLVSAISGRIREQTRVQLGYERHFGPNERDGVGRDRTLFQHVMRIGLVYGGTRRP